MTTTFRAPLSSTLSPTSLSDLVTRGVNAAWAWGVDCWQGLFATEAAQPGVQVNASRLARYRHPVSGQSWDGHGRQPRWLQQAVLSEGYSIDALRRAARQGWIGRGC